MASLSEIQTLAMELTVSERAMLASNLLHSLPPEFDEDDDGDAEALRRDAEMDENPSASLTFDEFTRVVGR